jgi:FdhD protein
MDLNSTELDRSVHRTHRVRKGKRVEQYNEVIAVEAPLEICVDCETITVTMRTPGADEELALGFLYAEGVLSGPEQVDHIQLKKAEEGRICSINVVPDKNNAIDLARVMASRRTDITTSACGLCGRTSLDDLLERCRPVTFNKTLSLDLVISLADRLVEHQPLFGVTGGVHGAALYGIDGVLHYCFEDVGRHNAVDKVFGAAFMEGALTSGEDIDESNAGPLILVVSGRASFEIVQKAVVAGVACLVSVSAPSSMAVDLAQDARISLVGFTRQGNANIYTHNERFG